MLSSGAAVAAAAHAARIKAIRSFGVVVTVAPDEFLKVVKKHDAPLIVMAKAGIFTTEYRYLASYKGLTFYAKSSVALEIPADAELVQAENLSIPS